MRVRVAMVGLMLWAVSAADVVLAYESGDQVVVVADAKLTVEKKTLDEVFPGLVLTVGAVNGKWLWVSNGKPGWLDQRHVIPFDRAAIGRLTDLIRANPKSASLYSGRAQIWQELGEVDIALADHNEAIRLDPQAAAYNNRGVLWDLKKEYDNAVKDYSEAIRLDPSYAVAYSNRGNTWTKKQEYEKAIADCSKALQLDSTFSYAHLNCGIAWQKKESMTTPFTSTPRRSD